MVRKRDEANNRSVIADKIILDPTCGGRTIWFDKKHPKTLYTDIRNTDRGCVENRPNFHVKPDMIMDFRSMDLPDNHFKLIVWDPPHLKDLGKTAKMRVYYGGLSSHWQDDIKQGFRELWRVLADYGILIFKWNERDIPLHQVLKCFDKEPLFGHTTGSKSQTYWMCFMKFPKDTPMIMTNKLKFFPTLKQIQNTIEEADGDATIFKWFKDLKK